MGWERRGNSTYYYRKQRVGGRVISQYVGGGFLGHLSAVLDAESRQERAREQKAELQARATESAIDQTLADLERWLDALTRAHLVVQGCHNHKGQWRRRRGKSKK